MKINILGYILLGFAAYICLKIYQESDVFNLKCVISTVDGKKYCVRERAKLALAADRLAHVNVKMQKLVKHCQKKYPNQENVKKLVKGFNPKKIYETLPTSEHTAYSENKGEKIAFCLNPEKQSTTLIDPNTLMFVATHELAHVATKSVGHTTEFWKNFKFLLGEAHEIGVYKQTDYKKKPVRYCGMTIADNPYYNY
jgi:predicted metal-dependent hydrolase